MHQSIINFNNIKSSIKSNQEQTNNKNNIKIIAVSKTFEISHINPLIDYGHTDFGENKVQEAISKWRDIKNDRKDLKLHMVGKLQSNKAKNAAEIFDYIHSLDSQKLADIFNACERKNSKKLKYFIQINIGNEAQKSGIPISEAESFYNYCAKENKLNILGLMIIPPNDDNTKKYFKSLDYLNNTLGLKELSMGMSNDYTDAIRNNATYIRIGSAIFGSRN